MRTTSQLTALALLLLAGVGCASNPIAGQWEGTCNTAIHSVNFELSGFDTDRIGWTDYAQGENEALMHHAEVRFDDVFAEGTGTFIRCIDPEGCLYAEEELGDQPENAYRDDVTLTDADGAQYRMVLDGVLEEKKAISGRCFFVDLWGKFEGERTESQWVDESKTDS